ncbi:hypothetical protein TSUD_155480 [Trifolium subterraneum]|uniref:Uncharacterized protein n=1 Tax=Trifolium subterraneum TaxID=3900 RepID=A0A2Z6NZC6_TRISU|nr:hypothetical protein TSUD_155480 [Trifolium subterraneum]
MQVGKITLFLCAAAKGGVKTPDDVELAISTSRFVGEGKVEGGVTDFRDAFNERSEVGGLVYYIF